MSAKIMAGILMGSDSDLPVMQDAAKVLESFGIPFRLTTLSAHRTPAAVAGFVSACERSGCRVFIAAAGGAAHLAGVVAAHTAFPVIGVPILGKSMNGLDSLLSTAQMPPGVPVATVAVNGAKNAGVLAAQILGASDKSVRAKVAAFKKTMEKDVLAKAKKLEEIGYKKYLERSGV